MAKVECTCQQCGNAFEVYPYRLINARYCSNTCRINAQFNRPSPKRSRVTRVCEHCGNLFETKRYKIALGEAKYCSNECKFLSKTLMRVDCICKQCGQMFSVRKSDIDRGRGIYCSNDCSSLAHRLKADCVCANCGTSFKASLSRLKTGKHGKYCSRKCFYQAIKSPEVTCDQCGKMFSVSPSRIKAGRVYCSTHCMGLAQRGEKSIHWRGGKFPYYGDNWHSQRKMARLRDGGICQYCHRKPDKHEMSFAIHHIIKRRHFAKDDPTANDLSNLITLCPQCHSKAEHGKIAVPMRLL